MSFDLISFLNLCFTGRSHQYSQVPSTSVDANKEFTINVLILFRFQTRTRIAQSKQISHCISNIFDSFRCVSTDHREIT